MDAKHSSEQSATSKWDKSVPEDYESQHTQATKIIIEDQVSQIVVDDAFSPFPVDPLVDDLEDEGNILRLRSIVVGAILGAVSNAANVYIGWYPTCSASIKRQIHGGLVMLTH